jgi:hypothetical protein
MEAETKVCSKCGEEKPLDGFSVSARCRGGYVSRCKKCKAEYTKQYVKLNREKVRESASALRVRNKEKIKEENRIYYLKNKEKAASYRLQNKDKIKEQKRLWRLKNIDKRQTDQHLWRQKNRDHARDYDINYGKASREIISDVYVCKLIYHKLYSAHNLTLTAAIIRDHPDLIESYREQIKIKRLLISKKQRYKKSTSMSPEN